MIAAVYARKSTEQRGVDDEAKSVQMQVTNARAFALEKGWAVDDRHVYFDDAVSGADVRKLKARQQLLDVIKRGAPFQVLIVREQSRFSRRDGDEAFGELKQIARAGVEIWFYKDRTRFAYGTFGDNILGFVKAEAAAEYRRQIAGWTYDAMERKAKAGHVTGGRCFGFDNVRVDGHVERRVNAAEAAVVRRIFELAASGIGKTTIAKRLNAESATAPRPHQGRPAGWTGSSVREILYRELYRGMIVWNRTKKRDVLGEIDPTNRPETDWVRVRAPHLQIVSEALWDATHTQLEANRRLYLRGTGGSSAGGRRGASSNARRKASQPRRIERVCRDVVAHFADPARNPTARRPELLKRGAEVETSISRLVDAIAAGGDCGPIVARIKALEQDRSRLVRDLAAIGADD